MASHHSFHGVAAASFLGMWVVMMVPMMLPSLVPMLLRYRLAVRGMSAVHLNRLTALVSAGYFSVWTASGVIVYLLGVALSTMEMQQPVVARALPIAAGVVVLVAGALQFTSWKARQLACWRESALPNRPLAAESGPLRHGVRLGLNCACCCANLMAIPLVVGIMDLRVMAAVTAAITAERLAPAGEHVARAIGLVAIGTAVLLIARAAGIA